MKYFYVDSTGWVSVVMFDFISDCLDDIRSSLALKSFSDSKDFTIYGIAVHGNRIVDGQINPLYTVYRDGDVHECGTEKVGIDFKVF